MTDHYEVLGVARDASPELIKAAYRRLASRLHPDRAGSDGEARMAAVNRAYEVLSDPAAREQYDRTGTDSAKPDPEAVANARLMGLFDQYLEADNEHHGDLVAMFHEAVSGHIANMRAAIEKAGAKVRKLEKSRGRLKGPGLFASLIDSKLVAQRQVIARARDDIAIDELVLKLLAEYQDVAPPPPPPQQGGFYSATTLTGLGGLMGNRFR